MNKYFNKLKIIFKDKNKRRLWILDNIINKYLSDREFIEKKHYYITGEYINLDNPVLFAEKLHWLKLYDRKPEYVKMVDKYKVKSYVESLIGEKYIIPTIGIWNNFREIDFTNLPDRFVLKTTHDSGVVCICKDKQKFNINKARKTINKSLKRNLYYFGREWPYKNVKPRIIAEEYLSEAGNDAIVDYKFYCFNGVPLFCQVIKDRFVNETIDFFDDQWNLMPFTGMHTKYPFPHSKELIEKPDKLEEMKHIASSLSRNTYFSRIDLYYINNKIYFGEITFYPAAGFGKFYPEEWNKRLGELLVLPV
jgi:hypothetical protein